jgi:perosamine synthetase
MTTWKVPQFVPFLGEEEARAAADCVRSGWITEGQLSARFVDEIKKMAGVKYGVLAPNGTLALYLALKSCGVGPGDEVIVPDLTFVASATAVVMAGARPVFVDVDQQGQMSGSAVSSAMRAEGLCRAVMPVHLYGSACPAVAGHAPSIIVVEDACQALGVEYNGRPCGSLGTASAFSFFADKTITTGEGGFVGTDDEDVFGRLRLLRNQGRENRGSFVHPGIGQNFRMTDLQAAIGLVQLRKMPEIVARKRALHRVYQDRLSGIVDLLGPVPGSTHIPFRTVAVFRRYADDAARFLAARGVEPRSCFFPLHRQPCFADIASDKRHDDRLFPQANRLWNRALCLPTFAGMTEEQIEIVCSAVEDFVRGWTP